MIKKISITLFVLVLLGAGIVFLFFQQQTKQSVAAAFKPVDCPKQERVIDPSFYQGSMIDTHIHIPAIPDGPVTETLTENDHPLMGVNVTVADYICMMDTEGTKSVFAFFPVWDPIRKESLDIVKKALELYPGRFVPFIMPPDNDNSPNGYPTVSAKTLSEMLGAYPGLFTGYGEIGLYAREGGALALPPDSQRLSEIYPVVQEHNLLVYVHLGEGQKEAFEKALDSNPNLNFIWHGDQLISEQNGRQNLSDVEDILSKHPNVYYGVDELYGDTWLLRPEVRKEEFLAHFKDPEPLLKEDVETWKGFIERHPDQVLWGTDRGWSAPWSLDQDVALTLNNYSRAFIGWLDPSVQEKFAYKNVERLLKARENKK